MNFAGGYYSDSNYDTDGTSFYSEYEGGGYESEESNSPVSILSGGNNDTEGNTQTATPIIMQEGGVRSRYKFVNYISSLNLQDDTYEDFFNKLNDVKNLNNLVPNGDEQQQQIVKIQSIIEKIKRNNKKYEFLFSQSPTSETKKSFIINFHPEIIAFVTKDNANVLLDGIFKNDRTGFGILFIMMKRIIMLTCILQLFEEIYNVFSSDINENDREDLRIKINGFLSSHAGQVRNKAHNEEIIDKDVKQFAAKIFKKGGILSSISLSTNEKPKIVETVKVEIAKNYLDYLKTFKELYTNDFLRQHTLGFEQYRDLETLKSYTNSYGREEKIKKRFGEKLKLLFGEPTQENGETSTEQQIVMGKVVSEDQLPINSEQLTQLSQIAGKIKEKIDINEGIIQRLVERAESAEKTLAEQESAIQKYGLISRNQHAQVQAIVAEMERANARQGNLNSQNQELQQKIQELTIKNKEFKTNLDQIKAEKTRVEGNRNKALAELETLKQTTSNLQQELKELNNEKGRIKQQLTEAQANEQNATISREGQSQQIAELENQLAEQEGKIQAVREELEKANQTITEQEKTIQTQTQAATEQTETLEKLNNQIQQLTTSGNASKLKLENQIKRLNTELEETKKGRTTNQDTYNEELISLKNQLKEKSKEIGNLQAENEQLSQKTSIIVSELRQQLDETTKLKDSEKQKLTNELQKVNKNIQKLESDKNTTENQIGEKNKQLQDLQSQLNKLAAKLEDKNTNNDQLSAELEKLRQLNKQQEEIISHEQFKSQTQAVELEELSRQLHLIQSESARKNSNNDQLNDKIDELNEQIKTLKNSGDASETEINLQITTLKERIDGLELEIKDKNEQIKNLENAANDREKILDQSLKQLNQALSESGRLKGEKDSIESELKRTSETIEQLSNSEGETLQELENRNKRLHELQSQLNELTAKLEDKNTTNDQLQAELENLRQLNEQIKEEKEQLSMKVANDETRRSQNADKISSLEQQIAELKRQLTQTNVENKEKQKLEHQLEVLTKQLTDAQTNLESSEGNVQALMKELDNLREQLETRKQEQGVLNEKLTKQYETTIKRLRKQLEETQGENSEQVNMIKAEMETLKAQLEQKNIDYELAEENIRNLLDNLRQVVSETKFQSYPQDKQQNDGTELTGGELFEKVKQLANNTEKELKLHVKANANSEELRQNDVPTIHAEDEAEERDIREILNILNEPTSQAGGASSAPENIQVNLKNVAKLMINLFQYMNIKTNLVYDDSIIRKIFNILSDTQNEDVKTQYTKMLSSLFTTKLSFDPETGMLKKYEDVSSDIKSLNSEINQYLNGKDFLNKLISDKIDKTTSDNYNVILHNINIILIYLGNLNRKLINLKKIIETQNKDTTFIKSLDALSDSRVITYTKIRDSENSSNPRYLYAIDTDKYTSNNSSTIFTNASLDVLHANGYSQSGEGEGVEYDQYYNYGPFTKVLYNTSNKDFGRDHMGNIMDKLQNGEDVFVIGYGASGAGKTTTLIYDKSDPGNPNKPGAIVEMLNSHKFEGIDVTIYELYNGNKTTKKENVTFTIESNSDGNFEYKSGGISGGISLAKFLQEEIDNPENRQTKATSNNPQSSRSHIIVDIHIEKRVHLFVGDFAGVENVFDYSLTQEGLLAFYGNVLNSLKAINVSNIDNIDINNINELLRKYDFPNKTLIEFSEQKNTDKKYAYQDTDSKYDYDDLEEMNKEISEYYKNNYNVIPENFADIISTLIQKIYPAADKYSDLRIIFKFWKFNEINVGNKRNIVKLEIGGTIKRNNNKEYLKPISIDLFYYTPGSTELLRITNHAIAGKNEMIHKAITDEIEISKKEFETNYRQGVRDILNKTYNKYNSYEDLNDYIKKYISNAKSLINSTNANTSVKQQNNEKAIKIANALSKRIKYVHKEAIVRSYEGLFINKTLENMRKTMTEIIKQTTYPSGLPLTPNFESSCIKQHCDPIMGTCFDVPIETVDINSLLKKDDIHDVIDNALEGNLLRINYCLCLVVNNTPNPNPPKIPYIDLTDMKKEYDRITRFNKGGLILFRQGVDDVRGEGNPRIDLFVDAIQKKIEHHTGYKYTDWISKDIVKNKLGSTLDSIITLYNQSPYISDGQMHNINTLIKLIKNTSDHVNFKQLIDIIDKNNNLTILGTLEFADQISKYNLKYERCGVDAVIQQNKNDYFNDKKNYFRSSNNVRRFYKNKLEFEYTPTQPQAQVQQHRPSSKPPTNYEIPIITDNPYDIKDNEKDIHFIKQIMDKNGYKGLHMKRDNNPLRYTLNDDKFFNDKSDVEISNIKLQNAINNSTTTNIQLVKEGKFQRGGTNSKKYTKKIFPKLKLKKNRITIKKSC
jgi:chromosome segregation ATPase